MYTCASCGVYACRQANREHLPKNCPTRDEERTDNLISRYILPDNKSFNEKTAEIDVIGYCKWTRLEETIEFCKLMEYQKIGLAFCSGLRWESKVINQVMKDHGLNVVSVICKAGGVNKKRLGLIEKHPEIVDNFEAMCNPILQAELLNEQKTEFNIMVGLCVGHDSLFMKYSNVMATTLIAKDRVLAHNPIGSVYCAQSYYKKKLAKNGSKNPV